MVGGWSAVRAALEGAIRQTTFTFDLLATDNLAEGLSSTTRGYCDLSGALVAAEIITELRFPPAPRVIMSATFTAGTTLYLPAGDDWVALDSHGVGSTALAALYWLYGVESAVPAGERRFAVTLSFPRLFEAAPAEVRAS